jgi:hypothetical protein
MRKLTIAMLLVVAACKSKKAGDGAAREVVMEQAPAPTADKDQSGGTGTAMALDEGKMGKKDSTRAEGQYKTASGVDRYGASPAPAATTPPKNEPKKPGAAPASGGDETPTRAWFPETFLFEPLIATDSQGTATVSVRVPDRLTTWRVLALAHSRGGAQGGAVTSFLGTLPVYVEPVVPKTLLVGDEVRIPLQLVNTTDAAVSSPLATTATNAKITGGNGSRTVPAHGSFVDQARLVADQPGAAKLRVALGTTDAIERVIAVKPVGRLLQTVRSGTLAAPRTLSIEAPAGSDPRTDRVRLLAFPGALALLRSELGTSIYRESVADDAYALLLAGRADELLKKLGDKADPEAVRTLSILTAQRALRDARTLDLASATLLVDASLSHADNAVLTRLGERAADFLAKQQRPDGTFGGGSGWTLQRVLVTTAEGTRAVAAANAGDAQRQRATAVATRGLGAFERNAARIEDPYTAAAILATGAVKGELADKLKAKVLAGIKDGGNDGAKYLDVGTGVVRADGAVPSRVEATAFAVLALAGDPKAPLADLGATLIGSYRLDAGWGDGRTNLVAMRAVLELFKAPLPDHVKITLTMDGKPIVDGELTRDKVREVLVLEGAAGGLAGTHEWKVTAEPAVPGLGYALELDSWVPWPKEKANDGLELAIATPANATVGKPIDLALTAVAPGGMELHVELALPAGVQADSHALERLQEANTITRFVLADGKVDLYIPALPPAQTFSTHVRVIPTLAGKLHAPASSIHAAGHDYFVPPAEWTIN